MAVIPMLLSLAEEFEDPTSWDSGFEFGIHPKKMCRIDRRPIQRLQLHPRKQCSPYLLKNRDKSLLGTHVGQDGFQLSMDVQQFKPSEVSVKTADNTIVIEAKHEEREDEHGVISRHFVRKCALPKGFDPQEVVSTLSSEGVLTVKVPLPPEKKSKTKERIVQIQHTGPARDSIKDNTEAENCKENAANGTAE